MTRSANGAFALTLAGRGTFTPHDGRGRAGSRGRTPITSTPLSGPESGAGGRKATLTPQQCVDLLGDSPEIVFLVRIVVSADGPAQFFLKEKGTVLWSIDLNDYNASRTHFLSPIRARLNKLAMHVSTRDPHVSAHMEYMLCTSGAQCALDAFPDVCTKELPIVRI